MHIQSLDKSVVSGTFDIQNVQQEIEQTIREFVSTSYDVVASPSDDHITPLKPILQEDVFRAA